tara:strand:+ start:46023 stop:46316 length:294 start_codon:yes stop_codon:yes gene_type:complete
MRVVDDQGNPIQSEQSKRVVSGILAIFLGSLGIHKFVLGYTTEGFIMLLLSVVGFFVTCGISTWVMGLVSFIEGVVYLTKSDEDFIHEYQTNKKSWF